MGCELGYLERAMQGGRGWGNSDPTNQAGGKGTMCGNQSDLCWIFTDGDFLG